MKNFLLAFSLLVATCSSAFPQSKAESELYKQLSEGPDRVKAMEDVLRAPEERSTVILYFAASVAYKEKRLEDSGFLFYAAQLRARFDRECFKAKGTGGDSPGVLFGALSQQLGSEINPAIMAEPKVYAKALARVKAWVPKASEDYDPGYEYTKRKTEADTHKAVMEQRNEFFSRMGDLSLLLNDADYFAAFRTLQKHNIDRENNPLTKEEKERVEETMKRIEREKKLKGVFTK